MKSKSDGVYERKEGIFMFEKSIIATDLSSASFAMLKDLGKLKAFGVKDILLLRCINQREAAAYALTYTTEALDKNIQEQQRILEAQGFRTEARTVEGLIKKEALRIAEEEGFSLIITGAETCTLVSEPLIGGIAYEIIHYSTKPVLLVRMEETKKEDTSYYEPVRSNYQDHILFPTDFSETANQAFQVLKELVAAGTKKVTLMHVQEQSRIDPYLLQQLTQFNEKDEERLAQMKKTLQETADVDVDTVIFYGNPTRDILDAILDRHVQLVVMGSQGRGYVKGLFLGSVSQNIARQAVASVLLVPAKKPEI